jgi:hypothetical protein
MQWTPFGDELRIVDLKQQLPGSDVLATLDGTLANASIDPRSDVYADRVRFSLNDERFGPREIPDRQANDPGNDEGHDGCGGRRACSWPFALRHCNFTIFRRRALSVRHAMLISRINRRSSSTPSESCRRQHKMTIDPTHRDRLGRLPREPHYLLKF